MILRLTPKDYEQEPLSNLHELAFKVETKIRNLEKKTLPFGYSVMCRVAGKTMKFYLYRTNLPLELFEVPSEKELFFFWEEPLKK